MSGARRLLLLCGPTASGKSDLALRLHARFRLRLISADSMQAYRGMDIGTAKPPPPERALYAGIDVADPGQGFSAGRFASLAVAEAEEAWRRGLLPCVVGGSGLYLSALTRGLAEIPPVPAAVRAAVAARPAAELARELRSRDPETASRIDLANPRRVQRAMEVLEASGRGLMEWHRQGKGSPLKGVRVTALALIVEPGVLRERIRLRAARMLGQGWPEEAMALERLHGRQALISTGAIGYAEMLELGAGRLSREAALEAVQHKTAQYARRQRSWFRREEGLRWMEAEAVEGFLEADGA